MKFSINFPEASLGIKLNCNNEAAYSPEALALLWKCSLMILSGSSHEPGEVGYIDLWIAADFLPEKQKADWPRKATEVANALIEREFAASLRQLRTQLHDASSRGTTYKHLFAAALCSARGLDRLMSLMRTAREMLELEPATATLISDLIAAELPDSPHTPDQLSRAERETILAIAMLVLNADEQKHVLELTALRIVMLALNVTATNNTVMAGLAKKGSTGLIGYLSSTALPTALLNILRIVIADRVIHARERNTVTAIAEKMKPDEIAAIHRLVMLESGTGFEM